MAAKKPIKDPNLFAKSVFDNLLDKLDPEAAAERKPEPKIKNPKKQAAGRSGGKVGGKMRAEKLPAKKRQTIARKAAEARWKKSDN